MITTSVATRILYMVNNRLSTIVYKKYQNQTTNVVKRNVLLMGNTNKVFQNRLAELRVEKQLSRQQLADLLGVSRASIEYYEKGLRTPDINVLYKLAELFNVSSDYLIGRTDRKSALVEELTISEYLGLSVETINKLHNIKENADMKEKIKMSTPIKDSWNKKICSQQVTPEEIMRMSRLLAIENQRNKNTDKIYLEMLDELIKNNDCKLSSILECLKEYIDTYISTDDMIRKCSDDEDNIINQNIFINENPFINQNPLKNKNNYFIFIISEYIQKTAETIIKKTEINGSECNGND